MTHYVNGYVNGSVEVSLLNPTPEFLERMAEAAHSIWMVGKLREGWVYGPTTDKARMIHARLVPYCQLSEADKESNREFVRVIPAILEGANLAVVSTHYHTVGCYTATNVIDGHYHMIPEGAVVGSWSSTPIFPPGQPE